MGLATLCVAKGKVDHKYRNPGIVSNIIIKDSQVLIDQKECCDVGFNSSPQNEIQNLSTCVEWNLCYSKGYSKSAGEVIL